MTYTADPILAATMAAAKARTVQQHQRTIGEATVRRLIRTLES